MKWLQSENKDYNEGVKLFATLSNNKELITYFNTHNTLFAKMLLSTELQKLNSTPTNQPAPTANTQTTNLQNFTNPIRALKRIGTLRTYISKARRRKTDIEYYKRCIAGWYAEIERLKKTVKQYEVY